MSCFVVNWRFLLLACLFFGCDSPEDQSAEVRESDTEEARLLQLQAPGTTGIDFINDVRESFEVNMVNQPYIYNGGGVAVLDYDGDGYQDVYFVSSQQENKLYRNRGDWTFEDVSTASGTAGRGGLSTGVSVVDINADGRPDLYVCRGGIETTSLGTQEHHNLLFVNEGNGSFRETAAEYGLNSDRSSTQATFFDYDGDGDLDCYLLNTPVRFDATNTLRVEVDPAGGYRRKDPEPGNRFSDQLFRNDGGKFTDVSVAAGIANNAFGLSAAIHDFNNDGLPDIFVGNDYIEPDNLFINQGDGTFEDRVNTHFRHTSNHTMGSDVGDINNDGLSDLITLDMLAPDNRRRKALETTMANTRFNTLYQYGYGRQVMWNTLQLNNGDGSYSEIGGLAGVAATDWSWAALFADFDNDRNADLYITNGYRYDITDIDYLTYTVDSLNRLGGISPRVFNEYPDFLKLVPSEKLPNYLFRNEGDLSFASAGARWGADEPAFSSGAAYADLDNDGDLDLLVNNLHEPAFVYRNMAVENGQGNYLQVSAEGPPQNPGGIGLKVTVTIGEERLVRELYPVRGFLSSVETNLHFGLGDAELIDELVYEWPDGKRQVQSGVEAGQRLVARYAEADGQSTPSAAETPTLFTSPTDQRGIRFVHRENAFEDFDREFLLPARYSREGPALAKADVNGDGTEDVFIGNASGSAASLYLQNGSGKFTASNEALWATEAGFEDVAATFFDLDGDEDLDLYVVSGGNAFPEGSAQYQDRLFRNDGKGNFSRVALPGIISSSGGAVLATDLDGDGDQDVLVGGRVRSGAFPLAPSSYMLRNDGGQLKVATEEILPEFTQLGMITDMAAGDLDGDGQDEIVIVGDWMPVTVLHKTGGKWTVNSGYGLQRTNGLWNSVEIADINGDGRPDIIAGNEGLNSRLRASESAPLGLVAADFDANGTIDPIVTVDEEGETYPYVMRSSLLKQLPYLKKRFPRNTAYTRATLGEVFTEDELAAADRLYVYTLASTVFLNGGGTFSGVALPAAAQMAPTRDVQVVDVDEDGNLDILLVGNDYNTDVYTGRYDAGNGLLLSGDGKGNWKVKGSGLTGIRAEADARRMALLPLADGGEALLVVNNDSATRLFLINN